MGYNLVEIKVGEFGDFNLVDAKISLFRGNLSF